MKIKLRYEDKIICVPYESVMAALPSLHENELRVLLYVCSDPGFRADTEYDRAKAIKTLDMQWASIEKALSVLSALGVIETPKTAVLPDADIKDRKTKASVKADRPEYSKDETSEIICRSEDLKKLINEDIPRITGKAVSYEESMIVVSMYDYLRMTPGMIMKIIEYCCENNMYSMRFAERTAYNLYDADITDEAGIDAFIEHENNVGRTTAEVKKMFGVGHRALIAKEKHLIKTWTDSYGYGMDMIGLAYETTIKTIGEPSLDYAGGILKRWFEAGYRTPSDVTDGESKKERTTKKKGSKSKPKNEDSSFDADEFMDAALKRSYSDNND